MVFDNKLNITGSAEIVHIKKNAIKFFVQGLFDGSY